MSLFAAIREGVNLSAGYNAVYRSRLSGGGYPAAVMDW